MSHDKNHPEHLGLRVRTRQTVVVYVYRTVKLSISFQKNKAFSFVKNFFSEKILME